MTSHNEPTPSQALHWLLLVILVVTAYRTAVLMTSPLNLYVDEAQYWGWAQSLAWGYYSKPPMIAALIAATTTVLGDSEAAVKCGALLVYPFTALVMFALGMRLYSARVGFWAGAVFLTLPGIALSSLIISTDVLLFLFWSSALLCLWQAVHTGRWRWWLGLGVATGLGLLTKYTMGIVAVCALLWLATDARHRLWLKRPQPWVAAALAALIFAPNLVWNAEHGWPTFAHTAEISHLQSGPSLHWGELGELIAGQLGVFGPLLFVALLIFAVPLHRWWGRPEERFLALCSLPFLALIAAQALAGRANANWAAMTYAAATVWVVARMLPRHKAWLVASVMLHIGLMAVAYHYHGIARIAGVELTRKTDVFKRVQGWDRLGAKVLRLLQQHPDARLLVEDRDLMAEMLYYARPRSATAVLWNPSGAVHNHYALTTTLSGLGNASFVWLSKKPELPTVMRESFLRAEPLGTLTVPVVPGWKLQYHATLVQGYMGYPVSLPKAQGADPVGQRNR